MCFDQGWDEKLISQLERLPKRSIITTYPSRFELEQGKMVPKPEPGVCLALHVAKEAELDHLSPLLKFYAHPYKGVDKVAGYQVAAGCLFTRGSFIHEVPYDPYLYFLGEEQSLALRAYTHGWDIWHVPDVPIYHLYRDTGRKEARSPMHWDRVVGREFDWTKLRDRSLARCYALMYEEGAGLGAYGLGRVRTLDEFTELSGIDYRKRKVVKRPY
jgi:GT2 family glycosyltransferase